MRLAESGGGSAANSALEGGQGGAPFAELGRGWLIENEPATQAD